MGCGFEPPLAGVRVWTPQPYEEEWATQPRVNGQLPPRPVTICAGYTYRLPEVEEVRQHFPFYKSRYLEESLGEPPTPELLVGCAILDSAANARDSQRLKESSEKNHGPR